MAKMTADNSAWKRFVKWIYDASMVLRSEADLNGEETGEATEEIAYTKGAFVVAVRGSVTGTNPTLEIILEGSEDGSTWYEIARSIEIDGAGEYVVPFINPFKKFRYNVIVGGTDPVFGDVELFVVPL